MAASRDHAPFIARLRAGGNGIRWTQFFLAAEFLTRRSRNVASDTLDAPSLVAILAWQHINGGRDSEIGRKKWLGTPLPITNVVFGRQLGCRAGGSADW
jgi:hypothetical protein